MDQVDPFHFFFCFAKIKYMKSLEYKLQAAVFQFIALACFQPWAIMILDWLLGESKEAKMQTMLVWFLLGLGILLSYFSYNCIKWSFYYDGRNK